MIYFCLNHYFYIKQFIKQDLFILFCFQLDRFTHFKSSPHLNTNNQLHTFTSWRQNR